MLWCPYYGMWSRSCIFLSTLSTLFNSISLSVYLLTLRPDPDDLIIRLWFASQMMCSVWETCSASCFLKRYEGTSCNISMFLVTFRYKSILNDISALRFTSALILVLKYGLDIPLDDLFLFHFLSTAVFSLTRTGYIVRVSWINVSWVHSNIR